jgi:hypothetical protein
LNDLYSDTCNCAALPDLADNADEWDTIYTDIARQLLNGEDLSSDALYNKTAAQLMAALNKGLGGTSFDDNDSRKALQSKFKQNIEQFSYAKTLTQFQLFKDAVFNKKGQIQSLATVKKAVADTGEVFNNNYLRAEHQYVVQTAIMAHKWGTLDSQYLEFTTAGDAHVRASHKLFDKFTALKSDPIWKRLYTPLDWGCRCTVIPGVAKNVSREYDSVWANKVVDPLVKGTIFDNNAALTGKVFTDKHPYFKATNKKASKIEQPTPFELNDKTLKQLEERKFKLDIDKDGIERFNKNFKGFNFIELDKDMTNLSKKFNLNFDKKTILTDDKNIWFQYIDTKKGFTLQRKLFVKDGVKTVYHSYFEINKDLQGGGISKEVFKNLHKQYKNSNLDKITVHANLDVGGYTWGRYGFSAYNMQDINDVYNKAKRLKELGTLTDSNLQHFEESYEDFKKNGNSFDMHRISSSEYGKKLLLKTQWKGELNLKDKVQTRIFEDYLGY